MAGIRVIPWYFEKKSRPNREYSGGSQHRRGCRTYGEDRCRGCGRFDWIPRVEHGADFLRLTVQGKWADKWINWDPTTKLAETTATLRPLVPVSGRVTHADGRAAVGVLIQGESDGNDYFRGQQDQNNDGRFTFRVYPERNYIFAVYDDRFAAKARSGIAVKADTPIAGIDFTLTQAATRVHGLVTSAREKKPRRSDGKSRWIKAARTTIPVVRAFHAGRRPTPKADTYSMWVRGITRFGPMREPTSRSSSLPTKRKSCMISTFRESHEGHSAAVSWRVRATSRSRWPARRLSACQHQTS